MYQSSLEMVMIEIRPRLIVVGMQFLAMPSSLYFLASVSMNSRCRQLAVNRSRAYVLLVQPKHLLNNLPITFS